MAGHLHPAGDQGLRPWLVLLLCAIFALSGLTGHDPWKTDDAINIGIAQGFATGGDWRVPTLAGEPFAEAEPLYPWLAAATAVTTKGLLPFHNGARLASALFLAAFLFAIGAAARRLGDRDEAWGVPLLAIGTLGLLVPVHEAQPASAVLAASALAYWGAALIERRPLRGGALLGIGIGGSFLAGGVVAAAPAVTLMLLPIAGRRWLAAMITLLTAATVGGAWLAALRAANPGYLEAWWQAERALLSPDRGFSLQHLELVSWFGWPVLYVAVWALWSARRQVLTPAIKLPLIGLAAAIPWFFAQEARLATLLPAVVPTVLLAASGCPRLRRGAANAWDWFGMMTTTLAVGLVWLGAAGLYIGWPERLARNIQRLTPGFAVDLSLPGLLTALAVSIFWLAMLFNLPRSPWRVACRWAAGVTVVWTTLAILWLPWIDYGKSYRPLVAELRGALPADLDCLARNREFGPGQRAALDYFGGLRTRGEAVSCRWAIHQLHSADAPDAEGWIRVWQGHRPGDRSEVWRLYRR